MKRLGKLKEILSQLIQLEKNSETAKDGRVIYWEGELAEGVALYVLDEEGNEVACPDGEVIIEDKKIVVADGKVSTIETVAAETPETDEPAPTEMKTDKANKFSAIVDFYSMSYDERWQLLYKAAQELYPDSFLYVEDAGDDYAVICLYGDDDVWEKIMDGSYGISMECIFSRFSEEIAPKISTEEKLEGKVIDNIESVLKRLLNDNK